MRAVFILNSSSSAGFFHLLLVFGVTPILVCSLLYFTWWYFAPVGQSVNTLNVSEGKKKSQESSSLSTIGAPSFPGQSSRASLPFIVLSQIKLDGDLYPPGPRQTHRLTWPACQKLILTLTLQRQHRLMRMQKGGAPINAGECHLRRHVSERGKKSTSLPSREQGRRAHIAQLQWPLPTPFRLQAPGPMRVVIHSLELVLASPPLSFSSLVWQWKGFPHDP